LYAVLGLFLVTESVTLGVFAVCFGAIWVGERVASAWFARRIARILGDDKNVRPFSILSLVLLFLMLYCFWSSTP
jgi:hypothetical protein